MHMDYMMLVSQKVLVACNNGRVMKRGKKKFTERKEKYLKASRVATQIQMNFNNLK